MLLSFKTNAYHCFNISFCPVQDSVIGCVASHNFGIAGSGALFILHINQDKIICRSVYGWANDGLYDLCWSQVNANILWSCSADGFIQIWDTNSPTAQPVNVIKAHDGVISCCQWNQVGFDVPNVLTSSWDHSVKVWDALRPHPVNTFGHESIVYCSSWSPFRSHTFATACADSTLRVWSSHDPRPCFIIKSSESEVLTCDWSKFSDTLLGCADTLGNIYVWDLRNAFRPLFTLSGHSRSIKSIKFSPHMDSVIASVSYDFSTRIWDYKLLNHGRNPLLVSYHRHREFVYGVDFNPHVPHQMADCSWDQLIHVFSWNTAFVPPHQLSSKI